MYGYIYMTINILNGKRYIGQHKSGKFVTKYCYVGSGRYLLKSVNKYGLENFAVELIDIAYSQKELNLKEEYWIEYYNAVKDPMFYNISESSAGNTIAGLSDEEKLIVHKNMSNSQKSNKNAHGKKGKPLSDINKKRIGDANRGNNHWTKKNGMTKEYLDKITNNLPRNQKGINHPLYGKKGYTSGKVWINNGILNKMINKELLDEYLSNGWYIGMKKGNK